MTEQKRGDAGSTFQAPGNAHSDPANRFDKQKITLLILALLALGTVFLLPRFVNEPWLGGEGDKRPLVAPGANEVTPSTAAEKTHYRQDAQAVLAQIIPVRDRLRERNVGAWADIEFEQAMRLIETGDEQYSYGEYATSLNHYKDALEQLNALAEQAGAQRDQALADGTQAVEALNVNVAASARDLAVMVAPADPEVQALAARVDALPELAALIERGDVARDQGRLSEAETAYHQAAALDGQHARAAASLAETRREMTDSRFRQHMSRGYAALEMGEFDDALAAFDDAEKVFPGHAAVAQARAQVANRGAQASVSQEMQRAAELEAQEQWSKAMLIYESLLQEDASLATAKARLVPVRVRAELDARLEALTSDPLKLAGNNAHREGQQALADARSIPNPGPRLQGQIAELDRMLQLAVSPVNVEFRSDNQTVVTLFRVKELGQFEQTTLTLKPGRYTVGGRRQGYRDVQVEFTVTGEPLNGPIIVRCEEPI